MEWIRDRSWTLVLMTLCALFIYGQMVMSLRDYKDIRGEHSEITVTMTVYLSTKHLCEALFENWESEFLQMAAFVLLTTFLVQKGSPESRRPATNELVDADPRDFANAADAPWPVKRGGWVLRVYEHSLGLVFVLLFLIAGVGHAFGGFAAYASDQV